MRLSYRISPQCFYNYLFDHEPIMESTPNYLQNHVPKQLAQSLCDLDMSKHIPLPVIGQIALKIKPTSSISSHTLFAKGELSHHVCGEYLILNGQHRDTGEYST